MGTTAQTPRLANSDLPARTREATGYDLYLGKPVASQVRWKSETGVGSQQS